MTLKDMYGNLMRQHQKTATAFSGILALYPSCVLHVVEGQGCDISSLLQDLDKNANQFKMEQSKIISCTQDIPSKAYKDWYCSIIESTNAAQHADPVEGNQCVKLASDTNLNMIKLGKALADSSPV
eukprot:TRINITY_DN11897_c0_g1_i1.p3 TRINITY_DN11897_c0_g1~~TRINITY_DN11897_c0_g1_i1.p3  ORF type:complete len:126 (-),score=11.33 TRINITY_DN11897_c0_g1_i1:252-629(-)